ncbi:MAG TPA: ATPase, T2SS/T4P/T4SS family [Tissierellales bacterium]|nr:ATPase, T2SS/T4P/T4SS family [Tissierellales bacterium]
MVNKSKKLGEYLIYMGKITREELEEGLRLQKITNKRIGETLVDLGYVSRKDVDEILELQLGISYIDLEKCLINPKIPKLIPESIARRYELIAIDIKSNCLVVAMVDPLNIFAIDDIKLATGYRIQPVISGEEDILNAIDKYYEEETAKKLIAKFEESYDDNSSKDIEEKELIDVAEAPVVRLVDSIISQAVKMNASDIHIEPFSDEVKVRNRVDGDLQEIMKLPKETLPSIVTRIKIIADMDIGEKRIPQDGRIENFVGERKIDMRISTLPTVYGEKIVIRLLDRNNFMFKKEELGFSENDLKVFNNILMKPYGIILTTGPAGSGKTTTLYSVLRELNREEKNIITVEDPVEYKLKGINQVQVNNKAGLTFANGLRSILRQDPDIIMIGEIRDAETASIAVRAAITGHLVFSTLHTNDTASSISRLVDMGIEPYLISSAVIGILSQRLVKKLCSNCKEAYKASTIEKRILDLGVNQNVILYRPKGCNFCNKGFQGRIAIHEVMNIDADIRELIDKNVSTDKIRNMAIEKGMVTLLNNAKRLALKGTITVEEVLRAGYIWE